mgnify:FL=1
MRAKPDSLIRPAIRALSAYHVPDPVKGIKLDAMENPYRWPDTLVNEWLERLRMVEVNRYPDPAARRLRGRLRTVMGVPEGTGILLGNGSDELIQMIALAVCEPGRTILCPGPTFVMYRMIAAGTGMQYIRVPLGRDYAIDGEAMRSAIDRYKPAVIFLAYPNNPTGNLFAATEIHTILEYAPGLVVVDEAYAPFTDASFLSALERHDNLLVLRTLSKMGLAGLRLGWLAGAPHWLDEFDKIRLPYNISILDQVSGEFALDHLSVFEAQAQEIRRERARLFGALQSLEGISPCPSEANFILFRVPAGRAGELHARLKDRGILIKNLDGADPDLADCLRVTVGLAEENRSFIEALRDSL